MKVAILGAGSWGTALAQVLLDNNHDVILYTHNVSNCLEINNEHTNKTYFPDVKLSEKMICTTKMEVAIESAEMILLSIPTSAFVSVVKELNEKLNHKVIIINTAKGFETNSTNRLSNTIRKYLDENKRTEIVSLIGPGHAEEVIIRDLTCITATSLDKELASKVANIFSNSYFRVYTNSDEIAAEIGVAMKNAIAIASGILEGLGYGDNARAALCTRGLAEMVRFGVSLGGETKTFLGLTGIGDLVVTCYSLNSRNFVAGLQIGKANSSKEFLKNNQKTVEGIRTIKVVYDISKEKGINLPIINSLYDIIYNDFPPSEAISILMERPLKEE
ncbi:MAG: NAD(P)H-dependent glycerol-3-phosphate dehydrogenase [Bacilli bacterium]